MRSATYVSVILAAVLSVSVLGASAQQRMFPLSHQAASHLQKQIYDKQKRNHTGFQPYVDYYTDSPKSVNYDFSGRDSVILKKLKHPWLWKKLRTSSFIVVDSGSAFGLSIDPLFNFQYMKDYTAMDSTYYTNTRGALVKGHIGRDVGFESCFLENQSKFPEYIASYNRSNLIVAGQGYPKVFKGSGFDYAYAAGKVFYTASKHFNFQLGHGKNFVGDGYRSLLLSDNSFSYPFLQITTTFWNIQYINLYTYFMDVRPPHAYTTGFSKKYGSFQLLSYNLSKSINISLFDGVVWQDSKWNGSRGYDLNYLNPIIFFHPIQANMRGEVDDNSILGATLRISITSKHILYGQVVIDDMNLRELTASGYFQEKYGFQAGLKAFDLFGIRHLNIQSEFNWVRPYTYAHRTPEQNYSHFDEPLAHPLGANFGESVSFINYRWKDVYVELKFNYAVFGADKDSSHWGSNIFKSDLIASRPGHEYSYGNHVAQGVFSELMYKDVRIGYLLNPSTDMRFEIGLSDRSLYSVKNSHNTFVWFSFKTALFNRYYDF